jgi:DNA mismatch repair protein MutL
VVVHDEEGILIVDQHALHERVMFEKLLERMREGPLERQRLLAPAIVEVAPRELEALEELGDLLARIGIEAEPAGPRAVAVHASPTLLFERGVEPTGFLRELLARAADGDFGRGDRLEASLAEILDMMACKAAIKAGDRLAPAELAELLQWRERVERSTNCPHGRPTSLRITIRELERRFGRG